MKIITLYNSDISKLDFDTTFTNHVLINEDKAEFFGNSGNQHYRLLSYISTLFDNHNIIDIGSHRGYSALALSYNKSNTIYSFDIADNVRNNIKYVNNIQFIIDNVFENEGR